MSTKITYILFLFLFFEQINAQEFAEFTTDTTRIHDNMRERVAKEVWYINGQEMHYNGTVIKIKPDPKKFDTIIYYRQNRKNCDTVICNITAANKYTLIYNECCGFFNVRSKTTKITGSVLFQIKNNDEKNLYLGTIGMTGILVNESNTQAIYDECSSAMSPSGNFINFSQVRTCQDFDYDNIDCNGMVCLWKEGGVHFDDEEYEYKVIKSEMGFLWLGLNESPLIVTYDVSEKRLTLE